MALPYDTGLKKKNDEIQCQNVQLYKQNKKEREKEEDFK